MSELNESLKLDVEKSFIKWLKEEKKLSDNTCRNYTNRLKNKIPDKMLEINHFIKKISLYELDISNLKKIYKLIIDNVNGLGNWNNSPTIGGEAKSSLKHLIEYLEENKIYDKYIVDSFNTNIQTEQQKSPLNQILYGPPGTGKTYKVNQRKEKFIYKEDSITDDEWLSQIVKDLTWFEVIALSLYDLSGSANVPTLSKHIFIKAKAKLLNKNKGVVPQQIWTALQTHTILESSTVNYKTRSEPFVFNKKENSIWFFIDGYEEIIPEIIEIYDRYKKEKPQSQELHNYEFITFHQSYGYEEFVEGIKAIPAGETGNEDGMEMIYKVMSGVFKRLAQKAKDNPKYSYAIFIDEINRGNLSKIFGELITLIEDTKRAGCDEEVEITLPYSGEKFSVSKNLYIIGTMNTADRSIALMDTALRRRFEFVEMMPNPCLLYSKEAVDLELDDNSKDDLTKIENWGFNKEDEYYFYKNHDDYDLIIKEINLRRLLYAINNRIEYLYDRDHTIGHSYFMNIESKEELDNVMRNKIIPLLQEYFYDDWEKIQMVLGDYPNQKASDEDKFIVNTKQEEKKVFGFDLEDIEDNQMTYEIREEFTKEAYIKIYKKIDSSDEQQTNSSN